MFIRSLCLYGRCLCRRSSSNNTFVKRYIYVTCKKNNDSHSTQPLKRFPDCEVVYSFFFVKNFSLVNIVKYYQTILFGVSVPISFALQQFGAIPCTDVIQFIYYGLGFSICLHTIGFICNNHVAFVYYKEDDDTVIISYVNYWGKRIDVKTTTKNINSLPLSISNDHYLYRRLRIDSPNKNLKINLKHGNIIDSRIFNHIFYKY